MVMKNDSSTPEETTVSLATEAKVAADMAEVFGDDGPSMSKYEVELEDETGKAEEDAAEEMEEEETKEEDEEDEEADEEAASDEKLPTLPAAHQRSLLAYGWTEEEIVDSISAHPEATMRTAAHIHKQRVDENARYAAAGRKAREKPEDKPVVTSVSSAAAGLKQIDVDALVERFGGNEEIIKAIVTPVNKAIEAIHAVLPDLQAGASAVQQQNMNSLAGVIDKFFADATLKPYAELYGPADETPSEEQMAFRNKVLEEADALIAGARLQNRHVSVEDALAFGHEIVSRDHKVKAIRHGLKKTLKKRANSFTTKPSSRKRDAGEDSGKPKTRKQLETSVGKKLREAFRT